MQTWRNTDACFNPFQGLTRFEASITRSTTTSRGCFNPFQGLTRFEAIGRHWLLVR